MKILGIIPARYASSRFPGKPLTSIAGKPMIQRVYEQALQASSLQHVIVATDDPRIFDAVIQFGGHVMMTSADHLNGTSRCAEVAERISDKVDYIINIQGDEPFIHPKQIDELAVLFQEPDIEIATQIKKVMDLSLLENNHIVKTILDEKQDIKGFQRFISADTFKDDFFYKHIGIYGFRADILHKIIQLEPTENELQNRLEQLRWLDHGYKIKAGITSYESISIDTPQDIEKALASVKERH